MASPVLRPAGKFAPKVALAHLDVPTTDVLKRVFAQFGVQTASVCEDFRSRFLTEQFQGCVVHLDDPDADAVLEAVRSSRSNSRVILYGIHSFDTEMRRFSKYGINAVLNSSLDRSSVLHVARSTSALLLNELRRYIRIPLVVEVSIDRQSLSGSSREISSGGMSVQLAKETRISNAVQLSFTLPDKPPTTVGASACWQNGALTGFKFHTSDPGRQVVKDWISSFLGLD